MLIWGILLDGRASTSAIERYIFLQGAFERNTYGYTVAFKREEDSANAPKPEE